MVEIGTKVKIVDWGKVYSTSSTKSSLYDLLPLYNNYKEYSNSTIRGLSNNIETDEDGTVVGIDARKRGYRGQQRVYLIKYGLNNAVVMNSDGFVVTDTPKSSKNTLTRNDLIELIKLEQQDGCFNGSGGKEQTARANKILTKYLTNNE